ncbi:unnamed protein product [Mucor hiemalis]
MQVIVGLYISFGILVAVDGLRLMVELYFFEMAKYLNKLSHLISSYNKIRKRNSSLDITELHRIINMKISKGLRTSLSFKKYFVFLSRKYFTCYYAIAFMPSFYIITYLLLY